jgi:hypothetical protein
MSLYRTQNKHEQKICYINIPIHTDDDVGSQKLLTLSVSPSLTRDGAFLWIVTF